MSFVITSAVILLMADSIRRVLPDESEVNMLTWIALAFMVYAVIVTVFLPKPFLKRRTKLDHGVALSPRCWFEAQ